MARLNMEEMIYPWETISKGRTGKAYVIWHSGGEGEFASTLNSAQRLATEIQKKLTSGAPGRPPMVKIYEVAITRVNPSLA